MKPEDIIQEIVQDIAFEVGSECLSKAAASTNKLGAVVGAIATVGVLGVTDPIAVPLALVGGALVGARGEAVIKSTAKGIKSTVITVAKSTSSVFAGILDLFKSSEDFVNRGLEKLENEQYKKAIEDFTQVIDINPKYADAYLLKGCTYSDIGNYQEAIADYICTIKIAPKYVAAYDNRRHILAVEEDYKGAVSDYTHSIKIESNDADIYFRLGRMYLLLENIAEAVADYSQVIPI